MKKIILFLVISLIAGAIIATSLLDDQFANANSRKKINFTQTITSSQDPGIGHESNQMAFVLSPNAGTLYYGTVTFTSSDSVDVVILHEINQDDSKGQPTWTVDGKTIYGLSTIDAQSKSNSFQFTGAAIAFHRSDQKPFTVTVSVDGWIRGQTPITSQIIEPSKEISYPLSRTDIPVTIPMHSGIYNNSTTYYIITDTNDQNFSQKISEKQNWIVNTSLPLSNLKDSPIGTIYLFTNGLQGNGIYGSQEEIFSKTPQSPTYSPLNKVVEVTWKKGQNPETLHSENEVMKAKEGGRIELKDTDVILDSPQIVWSSGQMKIRDEQTTESNTNINGQIIKIDKDNLTVTFLAHRSWDHDGKTIYQIITDGIPSGPAELLGIVTTETLSSISSNSTNILYQFKNGITGNGPFGFQSNVLNSSYESQNYSPLCVINLVEWNNSENAKILENKSDIDEFMSSGKISITIAHQMNNDYLLNCPTINPLNLQ